MLKYFLGLIKYFFRKGISVFALIDYRSAISDRAKVNHGTKIYDSKINSYSYVGPKTQLINVNIGKFCSIANQCSIGLATHSINNISTSPIFTSKNNGTGYSWTSYNKFQEGHQVNIGNDVWIGTKVIVMGGVNIGNGAIIGAGSIVTKDIPDYAIAVGIPAKVVKYRFNESIIKKLINLKWWDLPVEQLKSNINLFQIENFSQDDLDKIDFLNINNKPIR